MKFTEATKFTESIKFKEQLISLRKQQGLSQEQLGAKVGVTRQTVSKWELGETTPELDKLVQLSSLFGITLDTLVGQANAATAPAACPGLNMPPYRWHYEYKSPRTLRGLPLIHINLGPGLRKAKGVLAIGNIAQGIISLGAISAGIISLGALSGGIVSLGALSLGLLLAVGAISLGTIAIGGLAIGVFALGGCAIGIYALGGCALGGKIAAGGYANAPIAIGENPRGDYLFNLRETISPDDIKAAIIDKYPQTWHIISKIFSSLA